MAKELITDKIEKQGVNIIITVNRNKPIIYNVVEKTITSYTGRKLVGLQSTLQCLCKTQVEWAIYNTLRDVNTVSRRTEKIDNLIPWISYPELFENRQYNSYAMPSRCPKGFVNWLKENPEKPLSEKSLNEFLVEKAITQMSAEDKEFLQLLEDNVVFYSTHMVRFKKDYVGLPTEHRKLFRQIFRSSIKTICFSLGQDLTAFYYAIMRREYGYEEYPENWYEIVNPDRTFKQNHELLKIAIDKQLEKDIIATEDKGRVITELSNDEFTIVVPEKLEDLIDEGKQQHNCVGSHYNKSIANGENFVYFIRHTENKEKSYITSRFNINCRRTIETLTIFNRQYYDNNATKLIKKIDEKLKEIFCNEISLSF
jgi:hypothetical protein